MPTPKIMLIPIGDDNTSRRSTPTVTYSLIGLNVVAFITQLSGSFSPLTEYAVVPSRFTDGALPIQNFLFAMFMHGGWLHLAANMLYLWVFGDNVEDNLGKWKYLSFYLFAGVVGSLAHIMIHPGDPMPMIGASGAVMGVVAGYIFLFPKNQVKIFAMGCLFQIRAWICLGLYIGLEFIAGFNEVSSVNSEDGGDGVAHFAHIGGFIAGIISVIFLRQRGRTDVQIELAEAGQEIQSEVTENDVLSK